VLILGKTNDDKGTQLEQITQAMLPAKGFRQVRLNDVGTGGAEYDVTAKWKEPGGATPGDIPVLGECKARKDPINMTDWQKFLGKVYAETEQGQEVFGLFITTSNPNGNVATHYEKQRRQGKRLEFIGATEIEDFLMSKYSVCSLQHAAASVANFTRRTITSLELSYHNRACYWLVAFEKGAYTMLDAAGQPLRADKLTGMRPLLKLAAAVKKLINLYEEAEALRRHLLAQKHVLARLMLYGGGIREADLLKDTKFTREDVRRASSALAERGWLEAVKGGVRFTSMDKKGRYGHFVDVLKFWLNEVIKYESILEGIDSAFYDRHVDEKLLQEILKIQEGLPVPEGERAGLIQLLKLSPSAMLLALQPYPLITTGRSEGNLRTVDMINETDRELFYEYLIPGLVSDYRTEPMARHFWGRGIWELEYRQGVIVKNNQEIMFEANSRSRRTIRTSNVRGGFIHLGIMKSGPEPWEEAKIAGEKKSARTRSKKRPAKERARKSVPVKTPRG
jgi:hypothetical protein